MASAYEVGFDRALRELQLGRALYKRPFYGQFVYEFNPGDWTQRLTVQSQRLFLDAGLLEQTGRTCLHDRLHACKCERTFVLVEDWQEKLRAYRREIRHERALLKDVAERNGKR
jgi:hypothetical protein